MGVAMKIKKMQVLMILILALTTGCAFAAVSLAEQAIRYAAEQEGKHTSLAKAKEDVGVLRACLAPMYMLTAKPAQTPATRDIAEMMPSAKMVPQIVQPASTAIAASPRPEIVTASEEKK